MTNRLVWIVAVGSMFSVVACGGETTQAGEELLTATSAAGLACTAWTPIQDGWVTIGDNHFGTVHDGNFNEPFEVGDGYAFKIAHGSCTVSELRIYAHNVVGGPEVELTPLRTQTFPDASRVWIYKPATASQAFNIKTSFKGTPGSTCRYMTLTCTTD